MNKNNLKFMRKYIYVTLFIFTIRCFISDTMAINEFTFYDLYGYSGESIAFSSLLMFFYERKLWRYNPFENTPKLKEKYIGIIKSTFDGIEREAVLEVKQTLLSVSVILISNESKSKSVNVTINEVEGEWQLMYCYLNIPQAGVRQRSDIHYGSVVICLENSEELKGQYYTDRKTTGDMEFKPTQKEIRKFEAVK